MVSPPQVATAPLRPHRYPMLPAGGTFLICVGLGLIGAVAFSGPALVSYNVFYAGAAAGVVALCFAARLSTGSPTRLQLAALWFAILLEVVLLAAQGRVLPRGTAENVRWLWVNSIVGLHFLPMAISFGPRFAVLGAACMLNAGLGMVAPEIPYEAIGLIDGALKVGFGAWSFRSGRRVSSK